MLSDLTVEHESLIRGSYGITVGEATRSFDKSILMKSYNARFVKVKFPEIIIDVLWRDIKLAGIKGKYITLCEKLQLMFFGEV